MADAELRRAKREGGDEAVAEVMKRRMRAGELEPWKVKLLSWLHCRPAMLIYEPGSGGSLLGEIWRLIGAEGISLEKPWPTTVFCAGLLTAFEDLIPQPSGEPRVQELVEITADLRRYCAGQASEGELVSVLPTVAGHAAHFESHTIAQRYARAVMHALVAAQASNFPASSAQARECLGMLSDACYYAWEYYTGDPDDYSEFAPFVELLDSTCKAHNPVDYVAVGTSVDEGGPGYYFDMDVISECASIMLSRIARGFVHDWLLR